LMDSPNVLLLDEPTNDFDIETLNELEDLLDSYTGTLLVISHDRFFLERVCDRFVGLLGDKEVRDLPRGVDEYLEQREASINAAIASNAPKKTQSNAAEQRQIKKDIVRLERQIEKLKELIATLEREQQEAGSDSGRLLEVTNQLDKAHKEFNTREEEWLEATLKVEP
jgi:ABC transport system ATP-binding/permease protein